MNATQARLHFLALAAEWRRLEHEAGANAARLELIAEKTSDAMIVEIANSIPALKSNAPAS